MQVIDITDWESPAPYLTKLNYFSAIRAWTGLQLAVNIPQGIKYVIDSRHICQDTPRKENGHLSDACYK